MELLLTWLGDGADSEEEDVTSSSDARNLLDKFGKSKPFFLFSFSSLIYFL